MNEIIQTIAPMARNYTTPAGLYKYNFLIYSLYKCVISRLVLLIFFYFTN